MVGSGRFGGLAYGWNRRRRRPRGRNQAEKLYPHDVPRVCISETQGRCRVHSLRHRPWRRGATSPACAARCSRANAPRPARTRRATGARGRRRAGRFRRRNGAPAHGSSRRRHRRPGRRWHRRDRPDRPLRGNGTRWAGAAPGPAGARQHVVAQRIQGLVSRIRRRRQAGLRAQRTQFSGLAGRVERFDAQAWGGGHGGPLSPARGHPRRPGRARPAAGRSRPRPAAAGCRGRRRTAQRSRCRRGARPRPGAARP